MVFEEMGDFFIHEANDEIVMHPERGGGHVGRADEDGFFVEDKDFLMHEPGGFDGVDLPPFENSFEFGGSFDIVIDGCRDVLPYFLGEGGEDGSVA